jgi:hypothetical protein
MDAHFRHVVQNTSFLFRQVARNPLQDISSISDRSGKSARVGTQNPSRSLPMDGARTGLDNEWSRSSRCTQLVYPCGCGQVWVEFFETSGLRLQHDNLLEGRCTFDREKQRKAESCRSCKSRMARRSYWHLCILVQLERRKETRR